MSRRPRAARRGLTLIEVLIALVILTGVVITLSGYVGRFVKSSASADIRSEALDLATDRIETIKAYGTYSTLEATYVGTESNVDGHSGWTRQTQIQRTNTSSRNYKTVTVTVNAPGVVVKKTTVIASF